jgi:hypothetical protein
MISQADPLSSLFKDGDGRNVGDEGLAAPDPLELDPRGGGHGRLDGVAHRGRGDGVHNKRVARQQRREPPNDGLEHITRLDTRHGGLDGAALTGRAAVGCGKTIS